MKKVVMLFAAFLVVLSSCSKMEDPNSQNGTPAPLNSVKVGTVVDGTPTLAIDKAKIATAYLEAYEAEEAADFQLTRENDVYFLRGLIQTGAMRTTLATTLTFTDAGELHLTLFGTTQSCTSNTNCKGCRLTTIGENAGYCDCVAQDNPFGAKGKCIHSISQEITPGKKELKEDPKLRSIIDFLNR